MARYKHMGTGPCFLAVDLQCQLLPDTIEHALKHLLDHEIDLTGCLSEQLDQLLLPFGFNGENID